MRGIIRRRLLVNAVVDPAEAARLLPLGLRPHVTGAGDGAGTVVGCCLLDIGSLRPAALPAVTGINLQAAAHRISVEWDDESAAEPVVGVYVPMRLTDSRLTVALGGRVFPGVHRRTGLRFSGPGEPLAWSVGEIGGADGFGIHVAVSTPAGSGPGIGVDGSPLAGSGPSFLGDPVGATCIGAAVGLSPDHSGRLEAARMDPDRHRAQRVEIEDLRSDFLAGFATAQLAPAYLMQDIAVTWTRAGAPDLSGVRASADPAASASSSST